MEGAARSAQRNGCAVLLARRAFEDETTPMANNPTCPDCKVGDLIKISMNVGGRDLAFATCHHCEAKWWFKDGEEVPLSSVIGLVVQK
jgi:DNA polymerase III alpha subunit (gram-positive type)